jgi:hypothetical protein
MLSALVVLTIGGTLAAATAPDFGTCADVIPIPGNADSVSATACATCNLGGSPYYPCTNPLLCYCRGSPIPAAAVLPYTYCTDVRAVVGNSHGTTDAH